MDRSFNENIKRRDFIEDILDKMDFQIFIGDLETDEVIFINQKMIKDFGLENKEVVGKKCWRLFQIGQTERCPWCQKGRLKQEDGSSVVWDEQNSVAGTTMYNIDSVVDWPGYGKVHMQQSSDITNRNRSKEALGLLNRSAIVLLSHNSETFADAMTEGIDIIAGISNINRLSVFRNVETPAGIRVSQIYRWSKKLGGTTETREVLKNVTYEELAPGWEAVLSSGKHVNGPIGTLLKSGLLTTFDCNSVLAVPVISNDKFWGFVYFEDMTRERIFSVFEIDMLRSACLMLANVVMRNEEMKRTDEFNEYARLMRNSTPLSCVLWNKDLKLVDCNDACLSLFGYADAEECLNNFQLCCPEFQLNGKNSLEEKARVVGKAFSEGYMEFEWMHKHSNGTLIPSQVTLVRINNGAEVYVAAYVRDLRVEKRMNALLYATSRMSAILLQADSSTFNEALNESMNIMADAAKIDRVYLWKNHERADGKLCGRQIFEWSLNAPPQQEEDFAAETCYEEDVPSWEYELSRGNCINNLVKNLPDDQRAMLEGQGIISILVAPVVVKGVFWGFLGLDDCHNERVFTDNEENVVRSVSELIADAVIRNELDENLNAALEEARAANLAKSEFLSHMSHEMRTPLNAIIGMTSIGQASDSVERKDYALNKIVNASNHLLGVINDVLDMSKIEANKLALSYSEFTFEEMLKKVVNVVNFRVDEKHQSLYVNVDKNMPETFIGDDQRLAQVITNLLSNAIKFTSNYGDIRLNADILSEADGVYRLGISVEDNGIGLTEEQKKRVFKSFEQAETGTSRKYGGTGLGLAISKRIVALMGGELTVESDAGHGAKFSFTADLARGENSKRAYDTECERWNEVRIFAVDDEPDVLEFFKNMAANVNINCDVASSGEEALEMLKGDARYDVFFIDWKLPGLNGIELASLIHGDKDKDAVTLLFSSVDWSLIEKEANDAGINQFIPKPLFQTDVVRVIKNIVCEKNGQGNAEIEHESFDFSGCTVMLAEDVEINREIVATLMEPTGLKIVMAENGMQAFELYMDSPETYDLILMDVQMPVLDGYEATKKIRALDISHAKRVPIVAMTANVFREDIERCLNAGMNAHIGKPVNIDGLTEVLKEYLKG